MDAHQTTVFNAFLIGGAIIGIIILYFIISVIRHQRRNQRLYQSKILAEVSTLEKERARVSADLHDEIGPILASVKFKISSLDIHSEEDHIVVDKINKNIDELITRMRDISNELMPYTLIRKGLAAGMEESINRFNKINNLDILFTYSGLAGANGQRDVNLYRMVQEIIHNTMKHAKATQLKIEMREDQSKLIVLTEDNGIGFDYAAQSGEPTGNGLRNLLSRTEILGGSMYIESKPGKGTRYCFEIPV